MKLLESQRLNLAIIFLLTAGGFISGLFITFCVWGLLHVLGFTPDFWAMTEALATALAAATVLSAGFVAYRELKAQDIARYIDVADRLYDELNSTENIAARRWVFKNLPEKPEDGIPNLTLDGRAAVKQVLNSLDRVAFLTREGWIPDNMIMTWMNPMIVKSWIKLEPYVNYESARRNEPDYYATVRELADRCLKWRQKNVPNAKITWVDDAL
jgi:hypothetical protein